MRWQSATRGSTDEIKRFYGSIKPSRLEYRRSSWSVFQSFPSFAPIRATRQF